jgi:lipoprotein-anchoring transpeptidase ErfK/SrfK
LSTLAVALGLLVVACTSDFTVEPGNVQLTGEVGAQTAVLSDVVVEVPLLQQWATDQRRNLLAQFPDVPITSAALVAAMESGDLETARYLTNARVTGVLPAHVQPGYDFETDWVTSASALDLLLETFKQAPEDAPPVPANSGSGRRIVYSNGQQRLWLIEEGERLIDSYLISGKKGEPSVGNYRVYSKSPKARAFYGGITMNWMVRFAYGRASGISIGFHDLPKYPDGSLMQTEAELGQYRSAGCVRQPNDKAKWLYDWATIGTPVIVVP